jgi:hypothetical protein
MKNKNKEKSKELYEKGKQLKKTEIYHNQSVNTF